MTNTVRNTTGFPTVVGAAGRLVIPAPVRKALGIKPGQTLLIGAEDGKLIATTQTEALRELQTIARQHARRNKSGMTRELIRERREATRRGD
ncbi:MAG TPA: AbrB/MazE/SpoVT family DNA-binding domain-containing protein [Gammaproteobacteria bacterium]|nr:AbrB/MazE/SpoVT family DNA-binding domain-containing protein [Gammaproteobacteria bacterium]